jgi:glycosyltransferase involved in cell wall biosynthesis
MRVGILAGCLGRGDGGPETYERELIKGIARQDATNEYRIYAFEPTAAACLGPLPDNFRVRVLWPRNRWISLTTSLPAMMTRDGVDVLHGSLFAPPICPAPLVFTMHDASPITRPDFFAPEVYRRLNPLVRKGLRRARVVVCVSNDTLTSTAKVTGMETSRMRVVPHGVDALFKPMAGDAARAELSDKLGLSEDYFLYVGKIMARKNIVRTIEAYAKFIAATGAKAQLVLAGKRLYDNSDVDETIARLGLGGRIIELGYVPDALLPALYAEAKAFVYATLWEGFGLPILEAMASGTPVITSNITSSPEIAGDAALLVDPYQVDEIAAAMIKLHTDESFRDSLIRAGFERCKIFTWDNTARLTIDAYAAAIAPAHPVLRRANA